MGSSPSSWVSKGHQALLLSVVGNVSGTHGSAWGALLVCLPLMSSLDPSVLRLQLNWSGVWFKLSQGIFVCSQG